MTTITDWKALLTAQLECLDALSEDDIGSEVYVRDSLSDEWVGPRILRGITDSDVNVAPFQVSLGELGSLYYMLATKTLPIEPQTVTLIPWSGGECPVKPNAFVLYRARRGGTFSSTASLLRWTHDIVESDIIAYRPITIDIEEG